MVRSLWQAGANLDIRSWSGYTALHCAAIGGHLACYQCLLQLGANTQVAQQSGHWPRQLANNGLTEVQLTELEAQLGE